MFSLSNLLNAIPVDIVEMIIVSSRDYKLFEQLQEILIKLQEPTRVSRINDKLTIKCDSAFMSIPYRYFLNEKLHKEYDKPARIFNDGSINFALNDTKYRKNDFPAYCSVCDRSWYKNDPHRDNDLPAIISFISGYQQWGINCMHLRENSNPNMIDGHGTRYFSFKTTFIFNYINN